MAADAPLATVVCPLCGGANGCAPAESGRFDAACWCTTASFPSDLLARIPEAQRGVACLCAGCVASAAAAAAR